MDVMSACLGVCVCVCVSVCQLVHTCVSLPMCVQTHVQITCKQIKTVLPFERSITESGPRHSQGKLHFQEHKQPLIYLADFRVGHRGPVCSGSSELSHGR